LQKKVVIIGGGLGGMSAAIRLAADNYIVTIIEKGERLGGKINTKKGKGFSFDAGPAILTMPWILEQLFQNVNRNLSDYISVKRIEPQLKTFFADGSAIQLTGHLPDLIRHLESVSKEDASELFHYLHYCSKMYEYSSKSMYKKGITSIQDLRSMLSVKEMLSMDLLKTMNQGTKKFFKHKKIQQLFNYYSMFTGSSPYHAPAYLSQLSHMQLCLGIYYIEGGMYKLVEAMSNLLHEQQVNIQLNTEVKRIVKDGDRAIGVKLENGQVIEADIVISNLAAPPAYNTFIDDPTLTSQLEKYPPTVSGLILLLGVNKSFANLAHHNLFFSDSPEQEFQQIFHDEVPADDPTIYVGISAKSDSSQAPLGKENLFILTHVPPLKKGESWTNKKNDYRKIILSKLERMGLDQLSEQIEYEHMITPNDIQQQYGANGGSLYGVVSDRKKNGGYKIPNRSTLLQNLYFVGSSTHPGSGIPMVTLSGQITANLILEEDLKQNRGVV
jgi:diapolycopene oxygenase